MLAQTNPRLELAKGGGTFSCWAGHQSPPSPSLRKMVTSVGSAGSGRSSRAFRFVSWAMAPGILLQGCPLLLTFNCHYLVPYGDLGLLSIRWTHWGIIPIGSPQLVAQRHPSEGALWLAHRHRGTGV